MRILVATLRYPPYVAGGYELLTRNAVEALRARGHEVHVVCGRGARLDDAEGIHATLLPALPEEGDEPNLFKLSHNGSNRDRLRLHFLRQANVEATAAALEASRAELLLYFNLGLASLAPIVAARQAHVPTLGYVTDPWPLNHWLNDMRAAEAERGKRLQRRVLEYAWRRFRREVDLGRFRTSSDYLRRLFADDGIPPEDMELLRLPLPPAMMPEPAPAAAPARTAGEPLRVCCLSMLWEGKGVHVLLEAAAEARRRGADLSLDLAGDGEGEYRRRLEQLAADPALEGRVRFHGLLDRAAAKRLYADSHVVALPSIWGEPFPTATLEGMAHGLAAVATDAGGTPEQYDDGVEGFLVRADDANAMADALVKLAEDDALRRAMGAAALARVAADYTMDRFTDGLEEAAIEALLSGPR